ncbi:MAG TPA: papain-like cysteine protease family protein [Anaerolineae bacterium]|nr:papain-like cysteine protease family protein [Anaerolineales bacterium]HSD83515.1 papain-like cysteine protease family protein [Anaerolineae bacterium]
MKAHKFSLLNWKIIGLLCMAGLLLAGFTEMRNRYSIAQLQEEPLSLPVPLVRQSRSTSCGEAVITMTYNYAYPAAPLNEQEVIEYAAANGYYLEDLSPFTSPANMVKIAGHYADDVSTGRVISSGQGLALLIQKLRSGEPVIIDVLSNFHDPGSEAHFIVVTGAAVDRSRGDAVIIHYTDPLTGTKQSADWAGSTGLWNAWQTNGDPGGPGWWLVISPP